MHATVRTAASTRFHFKGRLRWPALNHEAANDVVVMHVAEVCIGRLCSFIRSHAAATAGKSAWVAAPQRWPLCTMHLYRIHR